MISQISRSYIATFVVDEQKGINHMLLSVTEIELAIIAVLLLVSLFQGIDDNSNSSPNTNTITINGKADKVW